MDISFVFTWLPAAVICVMTSTHVTEEPLSLNFSFSLRDPVTESLQLTWSSHQHLCSRPQGSDLPSKPCASSYKQCSALPHLTQSVNRSCLPMQICLSTSV